MDSVEASAAPDGPGPAPPPPAGGTARHLHQAPSPHAGTQLAGAHRPGRRAGTGRAVAQAQQLAPHGLPVDLEQPADLVPARLVGGAAMLAAAVRLGHVQPLDHGEVGVLHARRGRRSRSARACGAAACQPAAPRPAASRPAASRPAVRGRASRCRARCPRPAAWPRSCARTTIVAGSSCSAATCSCVVCNSKSLICTKSLACNSDRAACTACSRCSQPSGLAPAWLCSLAGLPADHNDRATRPCLDRRTTRKSQGPGSDFPPGPTTSLAACGPQTPPSVPELPASACGGRMHPVSPTRPRLSGLCGRASLNRTLAPRHLNAYVDTVQSARTSGRTPRLQQPDSLV